MRRVLFAATLLLAAVPGSAMPGASDATAIAQAVRQGRAIYAYDQAAWHGTDDMLARIGDARGKLGGYVADGPVDAPRLVFFDRGTPARALYVAVVLPGKPVAGTLVAAGDPDPLTADDRVMIAARTTATAAIAAAGVRPCGAQPFNTVVLPPDAAGTTTVFFLTPQATNDAIPLGGHYEVDVGADGKAGGVQPFTRTCLTMPLVEPRAASGRPSALTVSDVLHPTPTAIHVFSSLAARLPVFVVTMMPTRRLWAVTGATIRPVDAAPPRP